MLVRPLGSPRAGARGATPPGRRSRRRHGRSASEISWQILSISSSRIRWTSRASPVAARSADTRSGRAISWSRALRAMLKAPRRTSSARTRVPRCRSSSSLGELRLVELPRGPRSGVARRGTVSTRRLVPADEVHGLRRLARRPRVLRPPRDPVPRLALIGVLAPLAIRYGGVDLAVDGRDPPGGSWRGAPRRSRSHADVRTRAGRSAPCAGPRPTHPSGPDAPRQRPRTCAHPRRGRPSDRWLPASEAR